MADLTRKKLARFGTRAEATHSNGELRFPFAVGDFDRFLATYVLDLLSPTGIATVLAEAHRILPAGGLACFVSLSEGRGLVSHEIARAWRGVHDLDPRLVGGCRPIALAPFVDRAWWDVVCDEAVSAWGVPSEVLVLARR
jgi:hypothetical protein